MSITVSTSEQICHSPTNQSKSKMLYSFGRSARFTKNKQNECDKYYEINIKTNRRATNLGYGKKYDFTQEIPKTPGPGFYETQTIFNLSKRKKKGFGFGGGRSQMQITGPLTRNKNPGPGNYQIQNPKSSIYSSIKGKGRVDNRQIIYVPGPGTYQCITSFNKNKSVFFSKFTNKSAHKFARQQKLKQQDKRIPGPNAYDLSNTQFSPQGKYFYARLQSAKGSKFCRSARQINENRCKTPGPGNYRIPSQFGYYQSKNSNFNQNTNNKTIQ